MVCGGSKGCGDGRDKGARQRPLPAGRDGEATALGDGRDDVARELEATIKMGEAHADLRQTLLRGAVGAHEPAAGLHRNHRRGRRGRVRRRSGRGGASHPKCLTTFVDPTQHSRIRLSVQPSDELDARP